MGHSKKFYLKKFFGQRGFTLIELLVVIAIIGILSSIVLVSLNSARVRARDSRRVADIRQVQTALELYYAKNSRYAQNSSTCGGVTSRLCELVGDGFMSALPRDPLGSATTTYIYACGSGGACANPVRYHLGANLEDSSNASLNADQDCDSSDNTPPNGCPNNTYMADGFNGADAGTCANPQVVGNRHCYDVAQ